MTLWTSQYNDYASPITFTVISELDITNALQNHDLQSKDDDEQTEAFKNTITARVLNSILIQKQQLVNGP